MRIFDTKNMGRIMLLDGYLQISDDTIQNYAKNIC